MSEIQDSVSYAESATEGLERTMQGILDSDRVPSFELSQTQRLIQEHAQMLRDTLAAKPYPDKPHFLPFSQGDFQYDIIGDRARMKEAGILRKTVYTDPRVNNIDPAMLPLGIELDRYDAWSVHFFAADRKTGGMVAYCRLIPKDNPHGVQIEQNFDLTDYRADGRPFFELSRVISWPQGQKEPMGELMALAMHYAVSQGAQYFVGESRTTLFRKFFSKIGWQEMDPPREYSLAEKADIWGEGDTEPIHGLVLPFDPIRVKERGNKYVSSVPASPKVPLNQPEAV